LTALPRSFNSSSLNTQTHTHTVPATQRLLRFPTCCQSTPATAMHVLVCLASFYYISTIYISAISLDIYKQPVFRGPFFQLPISSLSTALFAPGRSLCLPEPLGQRLRAERSDAWPSRHRDLRRGPQLAIRLNNFCTCSLSHRGCLLTRGRGAKYRKEIGLEECAGSASVACSTLYAHRVKQSTGDWRAHSH